MLGKINIPKQIQAVAEGNVQLILKCGTRTARWLVSTDSAVVYLVITNFRYKLNISLRNVSLLSGILWSLDLAVTGNPLISLLVIDRCVGWQAAGIPGCLTRWSIPLQKYAITVSHVPNRKPGKAHCLSEVPADPDWRTPDNCYISFGVVGSGMVGQSQRNNLEIWAVMEQGSNIFKGFLRILVDFCIQNGVLYEKNFMVTGKTWLLIVQKDLRKAVLHACTTKPSQGI